uniref:hypothetical protein n=1 Tax=Bradyrhizobium sp. (strain ORS 278) TaxID=114615 RepID=UPI0012FEBFDB|nr:hypothetical protein [Bradyrhizobium sp. ORS 278]
MAADHPPVASSIAFDEPNVAGGRREVCASEQRKTDWVVRDDHARLPAQANAPIAEAAIQRDRGEFDRDL